MSIAPSPSQETAPVRSTPFPARKDRFKGREGEYLSQALAQDSLFYWPEGRFVSRMLQRANREIGGKHATAVSSGTAALHAAVGASGVKPGDEVIAGPITDMGTLIGILYQNAIPVFADVDPRTYQMSAESIERVMTDRTAAVIVVHLAGGAAAIEPIVALCQRRGVKLIEDCAQGFGCRMNGAHVGTFGDLGCFSLNDFKHLGAGDGGFIIANDEKLHYACQNYADKFYDRHERGVRLTALAPNYRMTELQGAVALAQFDRLEEIARTRHELGEALTARIKDIPGLLPHGVTPGCYHSYWFYMLRVDPKALGMGRDEFSQRLTALGIPAGAGYIPRPIYREPMFMNKSFFPGGVWPAEIIARKSYDYAKVHCPNAELVLETAVRLPIHENMNHQDVEDIARAIERVARK